MSIDEGKKETEKTKNQRFMSPFLNFIRIHIIYSTSLVFIGLKQMCNTCQSVSFRGASPGLKTNLSH